MQQAAKTNQLTDYDAAFARAMHTLGLDGAPVLITALSGGPDSSALACLAHYYALSNSKKHFAVIVNHAIRTEAADEAERVQLRMAERSIPAQIVTLNTVAPKTGLQEWARHQRFTALTTVARQYDAIILVAHHEADQAETVLMRLARGSGIAGLGGMRAVVRREGVIVARPLLNWEAQDMRLILEQRGCGFEDDPSNYNCNFERVRLRQAMANSENFDCLKRVHAIRFGRAMAILTAHLETASKALWQQSVNIFPSGYASIDMDRLEGLPSPAWHYWARKLIKAIGGGLYGVSGAALDRLHVRLTSTKSLTLGGCQFIKKSKSGQLNQFYVVREIGRVQPQCAVKAGDNLIFAGCWQVETEVSGQLMSFGVLGKGFKDQTSVEAAIELSRLPYIVRRTIPVLCTLDGTVIYPQIHGIGLIKSHDNNRVLIKFLGRTNFFYNNTADMTGK